MTSVCPVQNKGSHVEYPDCSEGTTWKGKKVTIRPLIVDAIVSILSRCLFVIAKNCVITSSSLKYKLTLDKKLIAESRALLQELGGKEVKLKTSSGTEVYAMHFDVKRAHQFLLNNGCKIKTEGLLIPDDEKVKKKLHRLGIKSGMSLDLCQQPAGSNYTVIYSCGSGHLFEMRKKTIGSFLLTQGMNVMVYHYPGTGKSVGSTNENTLYESIESVYGYLKDTEVTDGRIISYGHCSGAGPAVHLAYRHPDINLIVDRSATCMAQFCKERMSKLFKIPKRLSFLTDWIIPVMKKCFHFDIGSKIGSVRGKVAIVKSLTDELVTPKHLDKLYKRVQKASKKQLIEIDCPHDRNILSDEASRLAIGQFFAIAHL